VAVPRADAAPAGEDPVSLGEGFTPLIHATRLGATLGLDRLYVKDESLNPTNSFKARGQAAAITRARAPRRHHRVGAVCRECRQRDGGLRCESGLAAKVFLPRDVKTPFIRECRLYGADVTLVDGVITDAARAASEAGSSLGWYDVSTLKEPYRIEGKKTMAYELAEQMEWHGLTGSCIRPAAGPAWWGCGRPLMRIEHLGWVPRGRRPRMVSVQATGCAPIVRAFEQGTEQAVPWENPSTVADGLRVPRAIGDFLIPARGARQRRYGHRRSRCGDDRWHAGTRSAEGISAAPEGGAALAAIQALVADGSIRSSDRVVLFNTGGALKYLDVLPSA
jgi:threonine synthase